MSANQNEPVLVAGGGIGGLAAALALVRQGYRVKVLEQAPELGEIGAGIQLGPNAFHAFDALGVGPQARARAVYTDYMVMHDAIDEYQVGQIPTGEAFRQRFGNPYAVIHRADVHLSLLEGAQASGRIECLTDTRAVRIEQDANGVTVHDHKGRSHHGRALIGADGVKSVVREQFVGDPARVTGHVVYRAVVEKKDFPVDLQWNAASIWVGPNCHLVHYPLRGGEQYNVVVTFHSRKQEEWGMTDGSKEEVQSYFQGICPKARQLIDLPKSWRRWATADREPIGRWTYGRVTCWVTLLTRRPSTWPRGPAWPWKTRSHWARHCGSATRTGPEHWTYIKRHAWGVRPVSSCPVARWGASTMPRASSAGCAMICGAVARLSAFMTPWIGFMAGMWTIACKPLAMETANE